MSPTRELSRANFAAICGIFLVSGVPALVYQLVWQRSLFSIYGVNVESVTVVVAAFMLGLGLGSLAGGAVSRFRKLPLLTTFAVIEIGIGLFGYFSLGLFRVVGEATLGVGTWEVGLLTFALVLVPTLLMGATLPILTAHLVKHTGNVGRSIGLLYFVNTMGSALACALVALLLMRVAGMQGAVSTASMLNFVVAGGALLAAMKFKGEPVTEARTESRQRKGFVPALILVGLTGFIALSYEILWFRVHSFASGGHAMAFAGMLGCFLFGIAIGSLVARRFCKGEPDAESLKVLALFILVANIASFLVAPLTGFLSSSIGYGVSFPLVAIAAGALGATFPLICHYGVAPDSRAGSGLSYLYLANIIGATAGSLVTGFVLMDVLTTGQINAALALAGLALSGGIAFAAKQKAVPLLATGASALAVVLLTGPLFHGFYERLQYKDEFDKNDYFAHVVENRHGVITVSPEGAVYGGGMYDGVFNVDLMHDRNMIVRAFSLSAFHPSPKRVLMIGLASGSWAQVLAHHPQLEHMTIVEINPGYNELVAQYPEVAGILANPKVEIVIDDGRRWLNSNPDARFDAIVMNTTWHWRAHASGLLSIDFLNIVRKHLSPGGMALYNTTDSDEVQRTACEAFPHVVRVINNVVVSDSPLMPDKERWRNVLLAYRINGKPVVDLSRHDHREHLDEILGMIDSMTSPKFVWWGMEVRSSILKRTEGVPIVTDDNMGTEWLLRQRVPKRD